MLGIGDFGQRRRHWRVRLGQQIMAEKSSIQERRFARFHLPHDGNSQVSSFNTGCRQIRFQVFDLLAQFAPIAGVEPLRKRLKILHQTGIIFHDSFPLNSADD